MPYKRRDFIKFSATIGAGLAVGKFAFGLSGCNSASVGSAGKDFGLQLYTLRDVIASDPENILTQIASFGYKQIESYDHEQLGMFMGMKNTEFKKLMDDLDMKLISSHYGIDKDWEKGAAEAAAIGMEYLIVPWLGPQPSLDDYKKAAENFNRLGALCKKNGIRFAYHNHEYTFKQIDGQYPQDVLMQNTDKDLVDYQMDIFWVVTPGEDPSKWFDKYPDRFRLCHVKDREKNAPLNEGNASTTPGTGSINFAQVLKHGSEKGLKYFIVEQEKYTNTTPLDAAKAGAAYMKNLKI